jgi:hypothetical protein
MQRTVRLNGGQDHQHTVNSQVRRPRRAWPKRRNDVWAQASIRVNWRDPRYSAALASDSFGDKFRAVGLGAGADEEGRFVGLPVFVGLPDLHYDVVIGLALLHLAAKFVG